MLQGATFAVVGELTLKQLWHGIAPFPTRSEIWLHLLEAHRDLPRAGDRAPTARYGGAERVRAAKRLRGAWPSADASADRVPACRFSNGTAPVSACESVGVLPRLGRGACQPQYAVTMSRRSARCARADMAS